MRTLGSLFVEKKKLHQDCGSFSSWPESMVAMEFEEMQDILLRNFAGIERLAPR